MNWLKFAALVLAAATPNVAHAAWMQASSDHFVIYGNESERDLRQFAGRLERYHSALAILTNYTAPPPSPSNRVTIYLVPSESAVKKLYGEGSKYVGGFYVPRAGGSIAIVPQSVDMFGADNGAMIVLLHEYTHHFLHSSTAQAIPRWLDEGAAEFFSQSSFDTQGGMKMGRPAQSRAYELFSAPNVKAADLLDPADYDKRKSKAYDAYYGKAWLLYHYLTFEPTRRGQLRRYINLLATGVGQRAAAEQTFGDFAVLEKELSAYLRRSRMSVFTIGSAELKTGYIAIQPLSAGEAAMMPVRLRSKRGVDPESAKLLVVQARQIAARYPKDAGVLTALAEAEHDAGDDKAAIAAADTAIAIDPSRTDAYVQKGFSLFRIAADAQDKPAAYKDAMEPFLKLNKLENDHPLPLIYNYRSFVEQDREPNALAISGLKRASEVSPFDLGLRTTLALALLKVGRKAEARVALAPVAYDPHGGSLADGARKVLAKLDDNPAWNGADARAILASGKPDEAANDAPDPGAGAE